MWAVWAVSWWVLSPWEGSLSLSKCFLIFGKLKTWNKGLKAVDNSYYFEKQKWFFFWTQCELWLHKYFWYRMNILLGWTQPDIKVYIQFCLSQKLVPDFLKMHIEKSVRQWPCSSNFSECLWVKVHVEMPGVHLAPALLPLCYTVGNAWVTFYVAACVAATTKWPGSHILSTWQGKWIETG